MRLKSSLQAVVKVLLQEVIAIYQISELAHMLTSGVI